MDYLPDVFVLLGTGTLVTGVVMILGLGYGLVVLGLVLLVIGMAATWRRNS